MEPFPQLRHGGDRAGRHAGQRAVRRLLIALMLLSLSALVGGCGRQGVALYDRGGYAPPPSAGGARKAGRPYRVGGRWYHPLQSAAGYDETGIASWYGRDFHGRRTANGEIYDMHAMTAAHKTLPLPTMVRVTNLENGRSVVVRVNDRGPFVKNRLIDLSYAAARALGFDRKGTARVRVQALEGAASAAPPPPVASASPTGSLPPDAVYVQVGAFSSYANAERLRRRLQARFAPVRIARARLPGGALYRVRIGPLRAMSRVERIVLALQRAGFGRAMVVIE
ncbi:MAG: septal ring lytic transglycosylase RlpA family protein [Zetaproteobacteria bacterium]|nr:MAG: septal ring lytic transglycosylase RlpA family protein [Zetaproteobacteria bacterium]